jgi:threonine/homoserine/homoserine lactone efflux protein
MPVDPDLLAAFLLSALLISIAPGPDMVFVVASGIRLGPRAGAAAAVGVSGGMLIHTAAAVAGLSALIQSSAAAFELIRWVGVAYLLWLAVSALRGSGPALGEGAADGERSLLRVGRQGAITNLLNPKVILFFLAFLPQFVDPSRGPVALQLLILGIGFAVVGLLVDASVGVASGRLGRRLASSARVSGLLDRLAALVFVGLAVRLVWDR